MAQHGSDSFAWTLNDGNRYLDAGSWVPTLLLHRPQHGPFEHDPTSAMLSLSVGVCEMRHKLLKKSCKSSSLSIKGKKKNGPYKALRLQAFSSWHACLSCKDKLPSSRTLRQNGGAVLPINPSLPPPSPLFHRRGIIVCNGNVVRGLLLTMAGAARIDSMTWTHQPSKAPTRLDEALGREHPRPLAYFCLHRERNPRAMISMAIESWS